MTEPKFKSRPIVEEPLLKELEPEDIVAWFRCNSCTTCRFKDVLVYEGKTTEWCRKTHETANIVDMVNFFGYQREGKDADKPYPYKCCENCTHYEECTVPNATIKCGLSDYKSFEYDTRNDRPIYFERNHHRPM